MKNRTLAYDQFIFNNVCGSMFQQYCKINIFYIHVTVLSGTTGISPSFNYLGENHFPEKQDNSNYKSSIRKKHKTTFPLKILKTFLLKSFIY